MKQFWPRPNANIFNKHTQELSYLLWIIFFAQTRATAVHNLNNRTRRRRMKRLCSSVYSQKNHAANSTLTQLVRLFHTTSVPLVTLLRIFMLLGHCRVMCIVSQLWFTHWPANWFYLWDWVHISLNERQRIWLLKASQFHKLGIPPPILLLWYDTQRHISEWWWWWVGSWSRSCPTAG